MKKIIFLGFFLLGYADVSSIIKEISKIERFRPKFKKIKYYNIFEYEDIFKPNNLTVSKKENYSFKIYAIFQNKVNINGKWFKIGDIIKWYKILKITHKYIYLKKDNEILKISITNSLLKVK